MADSVRQAITVLFVLVLLGGTLFWLRRRGVAQFSLPVKRGANGRRLRVLERLPLSAQHSLHLISLDGRELLIGVSPGGCTILDQPAGEKVARQ
jgi:flagellar biogenesis protein FliO